MAAALADEELGTASVHHRPDRNRDLALRDNTLKVYF